ncbi:MAG: 30S ribosomal protein S2 [Rickettsiales bacterium]|jgi:small subunit ribosomal protein S2|nr:30S ribosomal protein S2 [Rickettsiales bacterium]
MSLPAFNMRELIEAGVHFGHKTKRWNPRMAPYIYGVRNDIHIIDLGKTVPMLHAALAAIKDVAAQNGRVLFVGTKRQASEPVAEAAKRCGQYYINQRWLGGLLTNWKTIQASIKRLRKLDENLNTPNIGFTKKELLSMNRERDKLEASLGGIKDMGGLPDMIFIIDTGKEDLAVKEARNLNIPMVAIVDSNCSVDGITYPIPGNDDSSRAIRLYCQLVSDAVLTGLQESLSRSSKDMGEREDAGEIIPVDPAAEKKAQEAKEDADEAKKGKNRGRGGASKKAPVVTVKKTPGKK